MFAAADPDGNTACSVVHANDPDAKNTTIRSSVQNSANPVGGGGWVSSYQSGSLPEVSVWSKFVYMRTVGFGHHTSEIRHSRSRTIYDQFFLGIDSNWKKDRNCYQGFWINFTRYYLDSNQVGGF